MRILRIIASLDPAQGGPAEGLRQSAALMAEAGHETEAATLDSPGAAWLDDLVLLPVHAFGPAPRFSLAPRLAHWIAVNGRRFDAAIIHGLWNPASIAGWQGLRRAGLPYAVFTHGMLDPWFRTAYPVKHWVKQAAWLAAQGWVLRDASTVLFTSDEEQRRAAGAFFGPRYHGMVIAYGAGEPPAAAGKHSLSVSGERDYLLFLGRIHEKKGCDLLIEAFAAVAGDAPGLDLVIAGPDQAGLQDTLAARAGQLGIGGRIHWPGLLQGAAKWAAIRHAAALVMPSHQENFGIAVAEALAGGVPVLVSDKVNICDAIEASRAGLVAPDTLAGTTDLLARFLALDAAQRAAMGANARACYCANFTMPRATNDLTRVLATIASGERL